MAKRTFNPIDGGTLEGLAKILGHTEYGLTGAELSKFIPESGLVDVDATNTKWKRLYNSFIDFQNRTKTSNLILKFINLSMKPSRFIGQNEKFELLRGELNKRLSFIGLKLNESGIFNPVEASRTITEAELRVNRFKSKLEHRNIHPKIYEYCNSELITDNYFHSVFEAVKSIAEEIRIKTGLNLDGSDLVEKALSVTTPLLKINSLGNETEKSEQKGFSNLIKGVFGMFRNTTAHSPKVIWSITEDEALDIMTTISLIHKKIDQARI
ncbi:TIGR02391 family protein [Flavobacterium fluvii]|uniref:TIGR02391 family protein n=1 Tax=Flavobacterium fluvii TaxID=468056 RepID=A0A1M5JA27_9FLAO|nr:TIGR02391 family protein [Flavobacterium fluvii]SHG37434.1 TIGR02391 family protein [Flavobacterium fluvii]